jgi:hypothetical protein
VTDLPASASETVVDDGAGVVAAVVTVGGRVVPTGAVVPVVLGAAAGVVEVVTALGIELADVVESSPDPHPAASASTTRARPARPAALCALCTIS